MGTRRSPSAQNHPETPGSGHIGRRERSAETPRPPAHRAKKPRPFTEIPYALQAGGRRFDPGWLHVLPLRPQTRA
jgi:hypothetical protein